MNTRQGWGWFLVVIMSRVQGIKAVPVGQSNTELWRYTNATIVRSLKSSVENRHEWKPMGKKILWWRYKRWLVSTRKQMGRLYGGGPSIMVDCMGSGSRPAQLRMLTLYLTSYVIWVLWSSMSSSVKWE